jgi:hypothetical protein
LPEKYLYDEAGMMNRIPSVEVNIPENMQHLGEFTTPFDPYTLK